MDSTSHDLPAATSSRRYDSLRRTLEDFRLPLWVASAGGALAIGASYVSLDYLTRVTLENVDTRMAYEAGELTRGLSSFANVSQWWQRAGELSQDKIKQTFRIVVAPTLERSIAGYMRIELGVGANREVLKYGDERLRHVCAAVDHNPQVTATGMRGEIVMNDAGEPTVACLEQPLAGQSAGTVSLAADLAPLLARLHERGLTVLVYDDLARSNAPVNGVTRTVRTWVTQDRAELRHNLPSPFQRWHLSILPTRSVVFEHAWFPAAILILGCITTGLLSYISFLDARRTRVIQEQVEEKTAELQRSNEELERFAYAASHDLRSPLRAVGSLTEFVLDDNGNALSDQSREDLFEIKRRIARMTDLLNGLLQYARATRSESEHAEIVDTGDLVRETAALLELPDGVALEISPAMPRTRTMKSPLELVFRNLLANACRHVAPETGRIRVEGRRLHNGCSFQVIDNGPGILPEHKNRVFNLFERLEGASDSGVGLGLALAKRCIESHGGSIWIEDTPGGGATMAFTWIDQRETT